MEPEEVVKTYKSLSHVERAFRYMKTVDLRLRPIYHHNGDCIRAHVFICTLAYYVEWRYCQLLWRRNFDLGGFLHDSVFENSSLDEEANLLVTV